MYSEKATKFWKNLPVLFDFTYSVHKRVGRFFFRIFVALSQYLNFYMNPQENVLDIARTHIALTKIFYVFRKRLVGKQLTHFVTLK